MKKRLEVWDSSPEAIWLLRSEAMAMKVFFEGRSQVKNKGLAHAACVDIINIGKDFHGFANGIRQNISSKGYTQLATLFDLLAIGTLAVHDLKNGKWRDWKSLIMSAASEGSILMASVQYIKAAKATLVATVNDHSLLVHDHMWDSLVRLRKGMAPVEIDEAREGLEKFFGGMMSEAMPLELRIAVLFQLYSILLKGRIKDLIRVLEVEEVPLKDLTGSGEIS